MDRQTGEKGEMAARGEPQPCAASAVSALITGHKEWELGSRSNDVNRLGKNTDLYPQERGSSMT